VRQYVFSSCFAAQQPSPLEQLASIPEEEIWLQKPGLLSRRPPNVDLGYHAGKLLGRRR
jgi:hypothetical protein